MSNLPCGVTNADIDALWMTDEEEERRDRIVAWLDSATTGPTVRARAAASAAVAKEVLVSAIRVSEPELLVTGEGERWLHQVNLQLAAGSPAATRAANDSTLAELRRRLAPDSVALVSRSAGPAG